MKLIDELGSYLGDLIGRARSARRLGEVVELEVAAEIPLLRHAQNLIRRSAAADHRLAESF